MQSSRGQAGPLVVVVVVILIIVVAAMLYESGALTPPATPPVELTNLKIGGHQGAATAKTGTLTEITYDLKHNDGSRHTLTVIFDLGEGARYADIVTDPTHPVTRNGTAFYYDKVVDPTDSTVPQRVDAFAHMTGLSSVAVVITISLRVDGKAWGTAQSVTLTITT